MVFKSFREMVDTGNFVILGLLKQAPEQQFE